MGRMRRQIVCREFLRDSAKLRLTCSAESPQDIGRYFFVIHDDVELEEMPGFPQMYGENSPAYARSRRKASS